MKTILVAWACWRIWIKRMRRKIRKKGKAFIIVISFTGSNLYEKSTLFHFKSIYLKDFGIVMLIELSAL